MRDAHPANDQSAQWPSQGARTLLSLLLFLHLFALGVVVLGYGNPVAVEGQPGQQASLSRRLLDVLGVYVETLNFNLGHRYRLEAPTDRPIEPVARYYLTYGKESDVDFVVEVEARKPDNSVETVTIPAKGLWPGERRRRYQLLANALGSLIGNDRASVSEKTSETVELILPRAVAAGVLGELQAKQGVIRCKAHQLLLMENVRSDDPAESNPFDDRNYNRVFEAQVFRSDDRVDLLKTTAAGEVAPVDAGK